MDFAALCARVAAIRAERNDPESAHLLEDELWRDVLDLIANGKCPDARGWATAALVTKGIEFPRWSA
jgi:hypothetical protein